MIDVRVLRDDPDLVRASQRARGEDPSLVDEVLAADERRRSAIQEFEQVRAEQKAHGKRVAAAPKDDKPALIAHGRTLSERVKGLETRAAEGETEPTALLRRVPNVVLPDVPPGGEDDYVVRDTVGTPRDFAAEGFAPRDHLEPRRVARRHRHGPRRQGRRLALLLPHRPRCAARAWRCSTWPCARRSTPGSRRWSCPRW
nr:hypothetical protein [Angustibacter aerolatus]